MKKNILIVYNYILHYRIPCFVQLSKIYNVTVIHSGKKSLNETESLKEVIVNVYNFGPFKYQNNVIKEAKKKYDIGPT